MTDHDTVAGLAAAQAAARARGMELVPGIELSAFVARAEAHILGHFLRPEDPDIAQLRGHAARPSASSGMEQMVEKMRQLGFPVTHGGRLRHRGEGPPGPAPPGAGAGGEGLVRGHQGGLRPVPRRRAARPGWTATGWTAEDAIRLIRNAGGTATLAHPGTSKMNRMEVDDAGGRGAWRGWRSTTRTTTRACARSTWRWPRSSIWSPPRAATSTARRWPRGGTWARASMPPALFEKPPAPGARLARRQDLAGAQLRDDLEPARHRGERLGHRPADPARSGWCGPVASTPCFTRSATLRAPCTACSLDCRCCRVAMEICCAASLVPRASSTIRSNTAEACSATSTPRSDVAMPTRALETASFARVLHLLDDAADVARGAGHVLRQLAHLRGHQREAPAHLARLGALQRRVERQQVRALRHLR